MGPDSSLSAAQQCSLPSPVEERETAPQDLEQPPFFAVDLETAAYAARSSVDQTVVEPEQLAVESPAALPAFGMAALVLEVEALPDFEAQEKHCLKRHCSEVSALAK